MRLLSCSLRLFLAREGNVRSRIALQQSRTVFSWKKSPNSQANAMKENEVTQLIKEIIDPVTKRRLGALGFIQKVNVDEEKVRIDLDTLVPGYQYQDKIKEECESKLKSLPWIKDHSITFVEKPFPTSSSSASSNLSKIHHIVGVSSCKGGVGKSTVAVNFACALAKQNPNLRVAILDADVYGPSLPIQLQPQDYTVKRSALNPERFIQPLVSKDLPNLKMLSFGFVNPNSGAPGSGGKSAALMRGPMASKVINQLLLATDWGEVDYLVVDMPPGTSDIHLTLTQTAQFTGAVIVTTPHLLALVDAAKGVELFREVNIPTLAFVENMSYFKCDAGKIYHPFGKGGKESLLQSLSSLQANKATTIADIQRDLESVPYFSLPLCMEGAGMVQIEGSTTSSQLLDKPLVLSCPNIESAKVYNSLASEVINQVFKQQVLSHSIPSIYHDQKANGIRLRYFTPTQAIEHFLSSQELRRRDPKSGAVVSNGCNRADEHAVISKIDLKGAYGVGIVWADRSDIFPFDILKEIVDELDQKKRQ